MPPIATHLAHAQSAPRASRTLIVAACGVIALFVAAWASAQVWVNVAAVFALIALLLQARLREPSARAWLLLLGVLGALVWIGRRGNGHLALDLLPVIFNAAVCALFARSLAPGATPLIARVIEAIEGRARLELPRVAAYARALTVTWTLVLGAQAVLLGVLAALEPAERSSAARWYLHFGGIALVPALLVVEYAFRRWWLRHVPHASLPKFLLALVRNWPALMRSIALGARAEHP